MSIISERYYLGRLVSHKVTQQIHITSENQTSISGKFRTFGNAPLTLLSMGLFGAANGWRGRGGGGGFGQKDSPPTMIKLGSYNLLNEDPKTYKSRNTLIVFC